MHPKPMKDRDQLSVAMELRLLSLVAVVSASEAWPSTGRRLGTNPSASAAFRRVANPSASASDKWPANAAGGERGAVRCVPT